MLLLSGQHNHPIPVQAWQTPLLQLLAHQHQLNPWLIHLSYLLMDRPRVKPRRRYLPHGPTMALPSEDNNRMHPHPEIPPTPDGHSARGLASALRVPIARIRPQKPRARPRLRRSRQRGQETRARYLQGSVGVHQRRYLSVLLSHHWVKRSQAQASVVRSVRDLRAIRPFIRLHLHPRSDSNALWPLLLHSHLRPNLHRNLPRNSHSTHLDLCLPRNSHRHLHNWRTRNLATRNLLQPKVQQLSRKQHPTRLAYPIYPPEHPALTPGLHSTVSGKSICLERARTL